MKKHLIVLSVMIAAVCLSMGKRDRKKDLNSTVSRVSELSLQQLNSLDSFLAEYPKYFYDSSHPVRQKKYEELAYYFKRAINMVVYFEPSIYYEKLIGPFQFQKNEAKGLFSVIPDNWIFTGPIGIEADSTLRKFYKKADSIQSLEFIRNISSKYRETIRNAAFDQHLKKLDPITLFDALRVEMFRITTVDLANGDFIIEDAGMPSLRGSVESWLLFTNELVQTLPESRGDLKFRWTHLNRDTRADLDKTFKEFDRMQFTRNRLIPLAGFLNELQEALKVPYLRKERAVRTDALHIYDKNVFNADYFAPHELAKYSSLKAQLGEMLFFDPILSGNNKRACASCHNPSMAFTDQKVKSVGFEFNEILGRNSPTVINSGFQKKLFWDQRASSLEDQLDSVVNNAHELNGSFDDLCQKIQASPEYVKLFNQAFPHTKQQGITREDVKRAIGVYERTVTGLNSRFDQYMQGDNTKLTDAEIRGFNLYMGKARCGTCHFAPLFNGALPPFYDITDHKSIGVPEKDTMDVYKVDSDLGLGKSGNKFFSFSFKNPTVRNVELTAPYMHNGVYKTLEQVVNFYDHAGGEKFRQADRTYVPNLVFFTIIPLELKLTEPEKKDLVAFMKSLTDTSAAKAPKRLPEIKGKFAHLNERKIGGEY